MSTELLSEVHARHQLSFAQLDGCQDPGTCKVRGQDCEDAMAVVAATAAATCLEDEDALVRLCAVQRLRPVVENEAPATTAMTAVAARLQDSNDHVRRNAADVILSAVDRRPEQAIMVIAASLVGQDEQVCDTVVGMLISGKVDGFHIRPPQPQPLRPHLAVQLRKKVEMAKLVKQTNPIFYFIGEQLTDASQPLSDAGVCSECEMEATPMCEDADLLALYTKGIMMVPAPHGPLVVWVRLTSQQMVHISVDTEATVGSLAAHVALIVKAEQHKMEEAV